MKYSEFKYFSRRVNVVENDTNHFFSKNFCTQIAFIFYKLGFSPNQVTLLFCTLGFLGGVALILDMPLTAYLLWRMHIIIDMSDGSLARATKVFSKNANGFDKSSHAIVNTTYLMGIMFHSVEPAYAISLMIAYQLNYNFSTYFGVKNKEYITYSSINKVIIKNAIGLEGLVLAFCILIYFDAQSTNSIVCSFFITTMLITFFIKLYTQKAS